MELEAFRLAERSQIGYRQLLIGMILAIVFGILITFWAYLHVLYDMGAGSKARGWIVYMGWETFKPLANVARQSTGDGCAGTQRYRR